MDPIDGSRNAKRGLPAVGLMLALAEGPTLGHIRAGLVQDLISGGRWWALRGAGAFGGSARLSPMRAAPPGRVEMLGLETSARSVFAARPLVELASKVRMLGSVALALAHTAAGGIDLYCSPTRMRVFDTAAGVLLVSEVGGVITDLVGCSLAQLPTDLRARSTLLASAHPDLHRLALERLRDAGSA